MPNSCFPACFFSKKIFWIRIHPPPLPTHTLFILYLILVCIKCTLFVTYMMYSLSELQLIVPDCCHLLNCMISCSTGADTLPLVHKSMSSPVESSSHLLLIIITVAVILSLALFVSVFICIHFRICQKHKGVQRVSNQDDGSSKTAMITNGTCRNGQMVWSWGIHSVICVKIVYLMFCCPSAIFSPSCHLTIHYYFQRKDSFMVLE